MAEYSTGYNTARVIFVIFNTLFALLGAIVFAIGIYLKVTRADLMDVLESTGFETATAFMVMCGIIVFVIAVVGFAGIWLRNQCIIGMYMVFIIIVFGFEIAAGVVAYTERNQFERDLRNDLQEGLQNPDRRDAWDKVQAKFECCGVTNYTDWYGVYDPRNPKTIPDSCCNYENCGQSGRSIYQLHILQIVVVMLSAFAKYLFNVSSSRGCFLDAKEWLEENYYMIGTAAVVIGVLHIILIIAPVALIYFIRRERKYIY